jgi:hypothetical protein
MLCRVFPLQEATMSKSAKARDSIIARARTMREDRLGFLVWSTMLIAKARREYRAAIGGKRKMN